MQFEYFPANIGGEYKNITVIGVKTYLASRCMGDLAVLCNDSGLQVGKKLGENDRTAIAAIVAEMYGAGIESNKAKTKTKRHFGIFPKKGDQ